jgi:hypothetical protein
MTFFRFRTRDPERDRKVDLERLGRLAGTIRTIRTEMEEERSGLRDRYERSMAVAAFSQQAAEDDGPEPRLVSKVDEMTEAIKRCTHRLDELDRQVAFATLLGRRAERFRAGIGGEANTASPAPRRLAARDRRI